MSGTNKVGRRDLLRKSLAWGGLTAAGGVLASADRAAANVPTARTVTLRQQNATYEVACLGDTFHIQVAEGNPEGDMRGSTFNVEGNIYPAGTIAAGPGFDPASATPIGRWFCRGWLIMHPGRPDPHVTTVQEYIFGEITQQQQFTPDQLSSNGLEGTFDDSQVAVRAVIGGTGRYAGANGIVAQHVTGMNTTRIEMMDMNAPNFRFDFGLLLPEVPLRVG
jgi:hypothetical protein